MLPGPVLVAMVTETGRGALSRDRLSLSADWCDAPKRGGEGGEAGAEGDDVTRPPVPWTRGILAQAACKHTHRHNGHLLKGGVALNRSRQTSEGDSS